MIADLIKKNRSCRRFVQDHFISKETMEELVDLARLSASASNLQPLKYIISVGLETNQKIFSTLGWAGYLTDWPGPEEGERPSAYIVVMRDNDIAADAGCDHGIACQSILLGAVEKGLAGCIFGSINRNKLRKELNVPDTMEILLVVAIGKPAEKHKIETVTKGGSVKYWRDDKGTHHVPKRKLTDIIIGSFN